MATLLKEALKCLCGENRWSYAIFWKIGCQNPTLLVWEDYHYEPPRNPAGDGLWNYHQSHFPQLGGQGEDRISSLLNKMMINNHVHVVGEGIVGRAAFTDMHLWILQENIIRDQYPSEVLDEVNYQFSAGMQTIAAIPVLPHGVVQLGSTLTIVENMGFINDVKSLFAQLGGAATFSSEYYPKTEPGQKIATPPLFGIPISADSSRNSYCHVPKFTPFINASQSQEISTSGFATQPLHSFNTQNQAYIQCNASVLRPSSLSSGMSINATEPYHIKSQPVIKPHLPLSGQLGTGSIGAQVILSNPDARLNQQDSRFQSSSRSNGQLVESVPSFNNPTFMEQQIASGVGQEPVNGGTPASNNTDTSHLRSYGGMISNAVKDSVIVSLLKGNQLPNARNSLQMLTSSSYAASCSSGQREEVLKSSSSDKGVVNILNQGNVSNHCYVFPDMSLQSHPCITDDLGSSRITKGKQVMGNDLYQTFNSSFDQPADHIPTSSPLSDYLHEHTVSGTRHIKESPKPQNVISDGAQFPSGNDLFDILGLDFKNQQLYGSWNNFLIQEEDANTENISMDASTCISESEAGHEAKDGISEIRLFNGTVSDHLLDAVVSKVHSSSKENFDGDMSCWTTLSKMNNSVLTDSLKSGQVNVPDQKQVKMCGIPSPISKLQLTGSSSFRPVCSLDNPGETSQISSIYGSQISLLCEDGLTMKRDNGISTAHSKKPDEPGKLNRKRLRPGENPRPRPKDRQMIQDRVKELREIVPNGAKCSIDALLERTIKHMLFLQSVTKHADKLKHTGESKIISKDGGLLLENNFDGGATWAFEVGSQSMVCPIIVEDLNTPRQMLVEMLCEEQGFFLEIADIIRGLGLTILKGVMEARNDKVWVRFTVEANRDVTRMEIFLSLVHLLEQTIKSNASASKGAENSNTIAHNTFHPASIPVTGRSVSLQFV